MVTALEHHSESGGTWWIDGKSGDVWPWSLDLGLQPRTILSSGHKGAASNRSRAGVGYDDMEDFIAGIQDRHAADLLNRAIAGRGAFSVSRTPSSSFPRRAGRGSSSAPVGCADERSSSSPTNASSIRTTPPEHLSEGSAAIPSTKPEAVARAVASDLRALYGDRLVDVVL